VTGTHPELGPELRRLAQALLNRIDPTVRSTAALAAGIGKEPGKEPGKCQQVWCPVCALAALVNGEQHPLVGVIAEHSVALLDVLRAIVDDMGGTPDPAPDDDPSGGVTTNGSGPDEPTVKTRYQPIHVTVEE
jgi:hypothetical protein